MRNLAIIIMLAACLLGCGHNTITQQAEPSNQGNLRFERNRLIARVMLPDSTAIGLIAAVQMDMQISIAPHW